MSSDEPPDRPLPGSPHRAATAAVKRWKAADRRGGAREAIILHGEDVYRLRLTANNKLILTK